MNIIIEKQKYGRIEDGINTMLNLDNTTFTKIIELLNPEKKILEDILFYYTSDLCENPSAPIQLGLEKNYDTNGKYIGRLYFGAQKYSIQEIFRQLEARLKHLKEDSKDYYRIQKLLETRDLDAFKKSFLKENRSLPRIIRQNV